MARFEGVDRIKMNMQAYEARIRQVKLHIANYFKPIVETYAKQNAPWGDITGNARQSLHAEVELSDDIVRLYLSHGMEYGVFLELAHQGQYAIILPTLEAHYGQVMKMLKEVLN